MNSILTKIFISAVILWAMLFLCSSDDNCPSSQSFYLDYSCQSCGQSSINIITAKAQPVSVPPLNITDKSKQKAFLINTGVVLEVRSNQSMGTFISGGPLFDKKYNFIEDIYFWTNNTGEIASYPINGVGTKIVIKTLCYNVEYQNFENARKYSDGLVTVIFFVNVTTNANPNYGYFQSKMQQVRQPGATVDIEVGPYNSWIMQQPGLFNEPYYFYQGSYNNEPDGDEDTCSYCSLVIVMPTPVEISEDQFYKSLLLLNDESGRVLAHRVPTYAQKNRKIFVANGINVTIT